LKSALFSCDVFIWTAMFYENHMIVTEITSSSKLKTIIQMVNLENEK